jgi:hypothetical protein
MIDFASGHESPNADTERASMAVRRNLKYYAKTYAVAV